MPYSLRRTRDGAGDSGPMSDAITFDPTTGERTYEHNSRPKVGACMKVGSPYVRSFVAQDWWMTTPITEILEDEEDYVRFKTGNSEYEWKVF